MRAIDADALREVIEDHVTAVSCCPTVDWSRGKTEFKEQCLEDIDNAPTIDICKGHPDVPDKWILVKDRKPPSIREPRYRNTFRPILLYTSKDHSVYVGWYLGEDYRGVDSFICRTSMSAYQYITKKITHWMPMPTDPEPPKGE